MLLIITTTIINESGNWYHRLGFHSGNPFYRNEKESKTKQNENETKCKRNKEKMKANKSGGESGKRFPAEPEGPGGERASDGGA